VRIALINSIRFYGGGEKRVLRGAYEFIRRGHEVTVVGQPDGELGLRCKEEGVPFAPVRLGRYYSPSVALALAGELRKMGAEVAVPYEERSVRIAALASRMVRGFPPVVYYYGLEGSFKNKPYNRLLVGPRVARYIANAQAIGQELLSFGWVPRDRLRVIYDGVDPDPIRRADPSGVREELGAVPEDVVALTVARLAPEKGHGLLVDVVGRIAGAHPRLRVWIAGEGPEAERLRAQVERLGLQKQVRLLGFRADVPRLLRAADILCHPSRREGAPNAVREGMCAGLPVVAVAASGTPELVVQGETGLLSPVDDAGALQRNLETLLADAGLRQRMGEAGRQRALVEFSEDRCAERWLEVLAECVRRDSP
jgi:glycosyltransferase involved in cell wall biosynthesis